MLILYYNFNKSNGYKITILITGILCIVASIILCIVNFIKSKEQGSEVGNTEAYENKSNLARIQH